MKICLVNPNTTEAMTEKAAKAARLVVGQGTDVVATNPSMGPESIEGYYDEVFSIPGLIDEITKHPADAYVLACFDDTGLDAARCVTEKPVVGIGEAAYHMASMLGSRFGVVTTLSRSVAALEHNLVKYGLMARCSGVRASDVPVLELESITPDNKESNPALDKISEQIEAAIKIDQAEAIVLGCAGMADLARRLSSDFGVPVVDGVAAAAKMAESLAALGLTTSKIGAYASPGAKRYSGIMQAFEPG